MSELPTRSNAPSLIQFVLGTGRGIVRKRRAPGRQGGEEIHSGRGGLSARSTCIPALAPSVPPLLCCPAPLFGEFSEAHCKDPCVLQGTGGSLAGPGVNSVNAARTTEIAVTFALAGSRRTA